ncbi:hypothetical protein D3C73_1487520 [compost metagenome]
MRDGDIGVSQNLRLRDEVADDKIIRNRKAGQIDFVGCKDHHRVGISEAFEENLVQLQIGVEYSSE